jgi:predicted ester cyclase
MISSAGNFTFTVDELIAEGDRVYARWTQAGTHVGQIDEHPPTGAQIIEVASAVYRVEGDRIVEYWIQLDRQGLAIQIEQALADH